MARSGSPRETAEKIILAAFKVLLPGMAGRVEGIKDIADIVYSGQSNRRGRQSLLHRLDESVDLLSERLAQFEAIELPNLQKGEKAQAIEGACKAMASVNPSTGKLIKDQLDPETLIKEVRPIAEGYWRKSLLSERATEYGEHYLELASRYITALVRELPEFSDELLLQNYATTEKIYELLQRGIATVIQPTYSNGVPSAVATFEATYLTDIMQSYKDMELFGLTGLPPELCRQPIDIAYIALQSSVISEDANAVSPRRDKTGQLSASQSESASPIKRVHAAFEAALRANMIEDGRGSRIPNPDRAARVLLTGAAGSGKTTVAHWLAIRGAEHRFPEVLRYWNDCFPFVVPLRHLFRGNRRYSPTDRDLVWASSQREGQQPEGWLESKLAGHALVILDGLDELSELHKSDMRSWANRLIQEHPLAHLIVTSRPEGLDYKWFRQQGFIHLELQPMDSHDVRLCVEAWFNAVVATDPREEISYRKTQKRLIADLEQSSAVRELAETPLLCAMLCAFYAHDLSAVAPQTRVELYERVINSLVHTREVARSAERSSTAGMPLRAKLDLLQALARYMVEQTQTTIRCTRVRGEIRHRSPTMDAETTAKEIIADRLRGMTPVAASSDELLGFLLDRSVVFRRIAPNEAQFVHRSLQEYLAGCDYADNGMVDELVQRSTHDDWQQILAFAAGKMGKPMASTLVSKLLDKAQEPGIDSRALLLLSAQCYGSAGRLHPAVAERTKTMLTAVLPPKTIEEAELVRYAGDEVLPWLDRQAGRPTDLTICCMRAAALIGGPGGMTTLAAYSEPPDIEPEVVSELLYDWQYFDAREYAEDILANLPLEKCVVVLESAPMVQAACVIDRLRSVRVAVPDGMTSFQDWRHLSNLEEIDWPKSSSVISLNGIGDIGRLRKLNLSDAAHLQDIADIGRASSLQQLYLAGCTNISELEALENLAGLEVLSLDGCIGVRDFRPITALSQLRMLSLNGCRMTDLNFCEGLVRLQAFRAKTSEGILDVSALSECEGLRRLALTLRLGVGGELDFLPESQVWDLSLFGVISLKTAQTVGQCVGLERLSLSGAEWAHDLSFLADLRGLRRLSVTGCSELDDARAIATIPNLEYLDLSGSYIADTQFLSGMASLKQLKLEGCRNLVDLSGLFDLPHLEYVSIAGGAMLANADELRARSASGQRLVVVEESFDSRSLAAKILRESSSAPGPTA